MSYLIIYFPNDYRELSSVNTNLIKQIKTYKHWCMLNVFNFVVTFELDERDETQICVELRNELSEYLNPGDKIFVSKLTGEAAWKGFNDNIKAWIKKYL